MLRIGSMNLMLNGVDDPDVKAQDSLSNQNTTEGYYTLIMANPPFSGTLDYEVVNDTLLAMTRTKKTELLFMSLFIRMLELGGRCASIVPDGVLFGTSTAHIALRKELVDHQRLEAIISMPSGVFKPYAGVSTAIVIFTKTNSQSTDKVWFYDMKADGFSLDDKRNEIQDNDIPDIIQRFRNLDGETERTRKEQSFFVPAQEIRDNDYSLAINKYKEVEREKVVYDAPEVILGRFEQLQNEITEAMNEFKTKYMK
jgi:type I restriction enzyme M protein